MKTIWRAISGIVLLSAAYACVDFILPPVGMFSSAQSAISLLGPQNQCTPDAIQGCLNGVINSVNQQTVTCSTTGCTGAALSAAPVLSGLCSTAGVATIGTLLATVSKQLPSSVTAAANTVNPMNAGSPSGTAFTAATLVASVQHIPLITSFATSSQTTQVYDFDGILILPPGWAMQITSSPVQSAVNMPSLFWAEHPV